MLRKCQWKKKGINLHCSLLWKEYPGLKTRTLCRKRLTEVVYASKTLMDLSKAKENVKENELRAHFREEGARETLLISTTPRKEIIGRWVSASSPT